MSDTSTADVSTVDVPASTEVVEQNNWTESTEPATEVTTSEGDGDASGEFPDLTEEQLNEIANMFKSEPEKQPTEPTFFTDKEWKTETTDNLAEVFTQMDKLIESDVEKERLLKEKDESLVTITRDIENLKSELDDKTQYVETFTDFYWKLWKVLDTETIDAIWEGDYSKVPLHLVPENWEKLRTNEFIYPFVEKILKWEEIDIPKLIIETVKSKQASLPKAGTVTAKTVEPVKQVSAMDSIVRWLRAKNSSI